MIPTNPSQAQVEEKSIKEVIIQTGQNYSSENNQNISYNREGHGNVNIETQNMKYHYDKKTAYFLELDRNVESKKFNILSSP